MLVTFFFRNKRYSDAYGDYNGGYGPIPPLGFGPGPGPDFWPRPPPPTIIMGRGFRPGGPPPKRVSYDDRPLKYLLRKWSIYITIICLGLSGTSLAFVI